MPEERRIRRLAPVLVFSLLCICLMPLTFNIATGFGFGFVSWVGLKVLTGRFKDLNVVMLVIALCFMVNFALRLH